MFFGLVTYWEIAKCLHTHTHTHAHAHTHKHIYIYIYIIQGGNPIEELNTKYYWVMINFGLTIYQLYISTIYQCVELKIFYIKTKEKKSLSSYHYKVISGSYKFL